MHTRVCCCPWYLTTATSNPAHIAVRIFKDLKYLSISTSFTTALLMMHKCEPNWWVWMLWFTPQASLLCFNLERWWCAMTGSTLHCSILDPLNSINQQQTKCICLQNIMHMEGSMPYWCYLSTHLYKPYPNGNGSLVCATDSRQSIMLKYTQTCLN